MRGWLFDTGTTAYVVDGAIAVAACAYFAGVLRLRRRGRSWSPYRSAAFAGGLMALFVGMGSGLASSVDVDVRAFALQHLLIMMVAPPLLVVGRPAVLVVECAGQAAKRMVVRALDHPVMKKATGPLSWPFYFASMWICLLPPYYGLEVNHIVVDDVSRLVLFLLGLLYWEGIYQTSSSQRQAGIFAVALPFLVAMPLEAGLGIVLMEMSTKLPGSSSLANTHAGGQVFWVSNMLVSGLALLAALWRWIVLEERVAAANEERAQAGGAVSDGSVFSGGGIPAATVLSEEAKSRMTVRTRGGTATGMNQ